MKENDTPPDKRHFYTIHNNDDGTVNVYLRPITLPKKTEGSIADHDIRILAVFHVQPFEGMEEDIRARYNDWCDSAEDIYL